MTGSGAIDTELTLQCLLNPNRFVLYTVVKDNSATPLNGLVKELALIFRERCFIIFIARIGIAAAAAA